MLPSRPSCAVSTSWVSGCLVAAARGSSDSIENVAPLVACAAKPQAAVDSCGHFDIEWHAAIGFVAGEGFAQTGGEFRVVGFPDLLAGLQLAEIDCVAAEGEFDELAAIGDFVNAAALFLVVFAVACEDDAIARGHFADGVDHHVLAANLHDFAEQHAALRGTCGRHEHLVIATVEPTRRKAARERKFHLANILVGEIDGPLFPRRVDRAAVVAGDVGDVLGRFQSAFDLEATHAGVDQFGHECVGGEVLRAEQILLIAEVDVLAIADQIVRQAAGLSTLAAIGTAAAERFAGEALARVGDTERTVNEGFEFDVGVFVDRADFVDAKVHGAGRPARSPIARATWMHSALVSVICVEA